MAMGGMSFVPGELDERERIEARHWELDLSTRTTNTDAWTAGMWDGRDTRIF